MKGTALDSQNSWPLRVVYLYLTERCNLKCIHCWLEAEEKKIKYTEPSLEDYERFFSQAKILGLGLVKISGGEPLIKKDLLKELLFLIEKLSINSFVETNGTLMSPDVAEVLNKTNTPVSISLDNIDPDEHNYFRGNSSAYSMLEKGFSILEKYKVKVQTIMTLTKKNVNQIGDMIEYLKKRFNIKDFKINPIIPTGRAAELKHEGILLDANELFKISHDLHSLSKSINFPIRLHVPPAFRPLPEVMQKMCGGMCSFPNLLGILANGDISFCGVGYNRPEYIFGNIFDINLDLKRIWKTNEVLKFVRESIPQKLKGVCEVCIHKNECKGECRVFADQTYGSLDAPAPWCQELYDSGNFPGTRLI